MLERIPGDLEGLDSETKRAKLEEQVTTVAIPQPKGTADPHNTAPSRVVHARAVPDGCTHQQMVAALSKFGKISYLTMMPRMRQALIEFENIEDAVSCVSTTQTSQVYIMDRPVFFNFSTSQEITRSPYGISPSMGGTIPPDMSDAKNHILLFTIFNPMYPITVDVIRTICSPYGFVQRIVVFRKNGLQVLVEFESNASAARAKQQLDGADIYAGCCTLKIEYAKTTKLNVYKNDEMTWDFTAQGRLLQQNFRGGAGGNTLQQQPAPPQQQVRAYPTNNYGNSQQSAYTNVVGTSAVAGSGSVIMIYGLTPGRTNCDHVFNLLCSYGNVLKVKVLPNKPGTAMAHMDNPVGAKNAIHHLHGHKLLGTLLELNYSRHSYIADYSQGGTLEDGSPCWKDFSNSRNNRFMTAEGTSKNRIVSPGKVLHFYNAPPDITNDQLNELFTKVGVAPPSGVKFFSQGSGSKSATGLLEWLEVDSALDAFVMTNHQTAFSQNGQAYTFKMAFSSNSSLEGTDGGSV